MTQSATQSADKKIFLIVTEDGKKRFMLEEIIKKRVSSSAIYTATDGSTGLAKFKNATPHVLLIDLELAKVSGTQFIRGILEDQEMAFVSIIITESPPEEELFVDELVTGRIQFLGSEVTDALFTPCLNKALNFSTENTPKEYALRFLGPGEILIHEGETGKSVFIVKKGSLRAYRKTDGKEVTLGTIGPGEFVGEMAYIHGEPRSADVITLEQSELIEVPIGTFEKVLYKRPAWSKTLMLTLSKRLKQANKKA